MIKLKIIFYIFLCFVFQCKSFEEDSIDLLTIKTEKGFLTIEAIITESDFELRKRIISACKNNQSDLFSILGFMESVKVLPHFLEIEKKMNKETLTKDDKEDIIHLYHKIPLPVKCKLQSVIAKIIKERG